MRPVVWRAVSLTVSILVLFSWGPRIVSFASDSRAASPIGRFLPVLAGEKWLQLVVAGLAGLSIALGVMGAIARTGRWDRPKGGAARRGASETGPSVARRMGLAQDAVRFLSSTDCHPGRGLRMQAEGLSVFKGRLFRRDPVRRKSATPQLVNPAALGDARRRSGGAGTALAETAAGRPRA